MSSTSSRSRTASLVLANILIPIAALVFATGFFPYKPFLAGLGTFEEFETEELGLGLLSKNERPKAIFDKVVFMVVDALRSDFVYGKDSGFAFVQSLINTGAAIPFTAHATSPTITMPRVKALTTGGVPSFLDVILNFAESDTSSTLATQDTWLAQIRANLRTGGQDEGKLVFYGDDTWLKLFPGFFAREDGTSSFFVSDFTEVDNNVTRHLDRELAQSDWNGMILHYLGLDHIGHKAGPQSPNMLPKQKEMDEIVRRIYSHTQDWEFENTLIVLAGDHGMNSAGNHGGSAPGETSPALVFMSPKFRHVTCLAFPEGPFQDIHDDGANYSLGDSILFEKQNAEKYCNIVEFLPQPPANPKWGTEFEYYRKVEQSDVVPTLAALLGIPIPRNNLGVLIREMLPLFPHGQRPRRLMASTQLLYRNALQIFSILKAQYGDTAFDISPDRCEDVMCPDVMFQDDMCQNVPPEEADTLPCLWHYVQGGLHKIKKGGLDQCLDRPLDDFLTAAQDALSTTASSYDVPRLVSAVALAGLATALAVYSKKSLWPPNLAGLAFSAVTILYGIMMFATSYVEEEQHFWYWMTGGWLTILYISRARISTSYRTVLLSTTALLALHRLSTRWNQTGQKHAGAPDVAHTFFPDQHIVLWILVMVTYTHSGMRLARRTFLNLCAPEVAAFAAASMVVPSIIFKLNFTQADAPELVQGLASGLRDATVGWDLVSQARTVFTTLGFATIGVVVLHLGHERFDTGGPIRNIISLPQRLHDILTLFLLTQTRVQNIPLFLLFETQLYFLYSLLTPPPPPSPDSPPIPETKPAPLVITLTTLLLTYTSFFALGNSNAISSIDLSNAYNGVSGYNVLAVGILLFCSNWAGPIWWASASVLLLIRSRDGVPVPPTQQQVLEEEKKAARSWVYEERKLLGEGLEVGDTGNGRVAKGKKEAGIWFEHVASLTVFVAASLMAVMAACTLLRTHLFIWTVFSPKYLYAMAWSVAWHLIVSCGFGGLLWRLS